jgi:hypothetical protein
MISPSPSGPPRIDQTGATASRPGPLYLDLQSKDLHVQMLGDAAAVATYHLEDNPQALNRRLLVLARTVAGRKIVHVHASPPPMSVVSPEYCGATGAASLPGQT